MDDLRAQMDATAAELRAEMAAKMRDLRAEFGYGFDVEDGVPFDGFDV